ncbi:MAG: hypothetical protein JRI71_08520 [Deltaproteobacteria bacterium]|nr:hypothetical protein [Deltaproteobacteria bacterium]MBW2077579.1 hypothetical protein [Deltaproteobacteria bacterium]MBW2311390.1 hypothetical protein [Deltaproteobacteria bacterium]
MVHCKGVGLLGNGKGPHGSIPRPPPYAEQGALDFASKIGHATRSHSAQAIFT